MKGDPHLKARESPSCTRIAPSTIFSFDCRIERRPTPEGARIALIARESLRDSDVAHATGITTRSRNTLIFVLWGVQADGVLWGPKCGVKLAAFTVPKLCVHPFGALGASVARQCRLRFCAASASVAGLQCELLAVEQRLIHGTLAWLHLVACLRLHPSSHMVVVHGRASDHM